MARYRDDSGLLAALESARARAAEARAEADKLEERARALVENGRDPDTVADDVYDEWRSLVECANRAQAEADELEGELRVRERRREYARGLLEADEAREARGQRRRHSEPGCVGLSERTREEREMTTMTDPLVASHVREARDAARRAIDRALDWLEPRAADRLDDMIHRDLTGVDSRYLAAIANPDYERAFALIVRHPQDAQLRMSPAELEAVRIVTQTLSQRDMLTGSPSAGGYGVPFSLDPTVLLSSDGSLNPLRRLASTATITTNEWRGITSEGVSASFAAEATEASDNTPPLVQPTIWPERFQMFVPVSIELAGDWPSLAEQLRRMFADARDNLEATKFLRGAGHDSDEPEGLLTGLEEESFVDTESTGTLGVDDVYAAQEDLGPRFQPRATWLTSLPIANLIHRMSGPGGDEPPLFSEGRSRLLAKPWREYSAMDTAVEQNAEIAIYGDLQAAYKIVDRVGLTVELIPHLFGTGNNYPTGQRGFYAYGRVGAGVIVPNAVRVLRVRGS